MSVDLIRMSLDLQLDRGGYSRKFRLSRPRSKFVVRAEQPNNNGVTTTSLSLRTKIFNVNLANRPIFELVKLTNERALIGILIGVMNVSVSDVFVYIVSRTVTGLVTGGRRVVKYVQIH